MLDTTLNLLSYIDPGTGSMIFQVMAAAVMGIVVAFQSVRIWILSLFSWLPWVKNPVSKECVSTQIESADSSPAETSEAGSGSTNG